MSTKITAKEFVEDYMLNHPDNIDDSTGEPYYDELSEFFREIGHDYEGSQDHDSHRHWTEFTAVQEINGRLIGYEWASTNSDNSIWDIGWEFDEDTLCFVKDVEVQVTVTKYIKED
jgi:hypothetical protein